MKSLSPLLAFVLLFAPLAFSTDTQTPRTPAVILEDIGQARVAVPKFDEARKADEKYCKQFDAEYKAAQQKVCDLSLELFQSKPDHPNVVVMMHERWNILCQLDRTDEAVAEMESLMKKESTPAPLVAEARMSIAYAHIGKLQVNPEAPDPARLAKAQAAIDAFLAASPKDARGFDMLWELGLLYDGQPEKERAVFQRLMDDYPASRRDAVIRGKLRQLSGVGQPFELEFDDAVDGKHVNLADLKGKFVVVIFWSSAIPRSTAALPAQKATYAKYHDKGVEFIGISVDATQDKGGKSSLLDTVKAQGMTWPQYYQGGGWTSTFSTSWGVLKVPQVFVLDREGKLVNTDASLGLDGVLEKLVASPKK